MKKAVLLSLILILETQTTLGMDKLETEIVRITTLMCSKPEKAAVVSAALALNTSLRQVHALQQLDTSEIHRIYYIKADNYKGYHADLNNGDTIYADFIIDGPAKGWYHCIRSKKNSNGDCVAIPLKSNVFDQLCALYESQDNNKEIS